MKALSYSRGVVLCIIATIAFGGMFPAMEHALPYIDPFTFTCLRYALAGLVFLAVLLVREGPGSLNLRGERAGLAWFFGTCGFLGFQFLVFFGQRLLGPDGILIASIMMVTQPMMAYFVNWVVRKSAPPALALVFILLSFVGVTLVVSGGDLGSLLSGGTGQIGPALMVVLGGLCWVIYTVGSVYFPSWSPVRYATTTIGLGLTSTIPATAVLLALGLVPVPGIGAVVTVIPEILYMGLVAGFVGVLCWTAGNRILTPLNGTLFMDIIPITAFTVAMIEGNVPAPIQFVGAGISAAALVLNNIYLRHRIAAPTPAQEPSEPAVETAAETEIQSETSDARSAA